MKSSWKGHITLGQLGFPVRLYSASRSIRPKLRYLHDKDGSTVSRAYICTDEGKEIEFRDIVKAAETEDGRLIPMTDNELSYTAGESGKIIAIRQFFDKHLAPRMYFVKPFYIVPGKGGERAYALLRDVLARLNKMALSQFALQNIEHIAAIGTHRNMLVLHQLRFAGEIVPSSELRMPALPKPSPKEIETFSNLVKRYSGPLYLEDYRDEQNDRLNELIERKSKGLSAPRHSKKHVEATTDDDLLPLLEDALKEK